MRAESRARGRRVRLFAAAIAVALAASAGCSTGPDVPPESAGTVDEAWQHVRVRVPADRYEEFAEGGGLIRRLAPEDADGQPDGWLGYFPRSELRRLEERGLRWSHLPAGVLRPTALGGPPCPEPGVVHEQFCPYSGPSYAAACNRSIYDQLLQAEMDYPPISGTAFVEHVHFGGTHEGRKMLAVRVGKISKGGGPAVPQLVVYAGQHAREWIGPEMMMRLYRYFANSYRDGTNGVRALLANAAIVFVPVANPDGYDYSHAAPGNRLWRVNREPCDGGIGTDPNRNFETTWGQPGAGAACIDSNNSSYRGDDAGSAGETEPLLKLLANDGLPGHYRTRFSFNVHAYGNLLLLPEGIGAAPDFKFCTTNGNCTSPDHGIIQDLVGTELTTPLVDEETGRPYISAQLHRSLYAASGDSSTAAVYGTAARPNDAKILSASAEISHTECAFRAEAIPPAQLDALFDRLRKLHTQLASKIPGLHDGSLEPSFHLPHLHRRQVSGDAKEYPAIRVAARAELGDIELNGLGPAEQDDVRDGAVYRMWRAYSAGDPYKFPTTVPVCLKNQCSSVMLGDPGGGSVHLCDPGLFPEADPSWSFAPDLPGGPQEECFWKNSGSGSLTSSKWGIGNMVKARLVYSYRWTAGVKMRVLVSKNGFTGCSHDTGTGCRIVREFPYGDSNVDLRNTDYRTDIVDVSDFDRSSYVQLRFEVSSDVGTVEIFDPIMIGWEG